MSCNDSFWLLRPSWIALTPLASRREVWFQVTPWIAEFWCCVSNVGFLYVARRYQERGVLFAGVASMLSHAIPWRVFHWLDKMGVLVALGSVGLRLWQKRLDVSSMVKGVLALGGVNALDYLLSSYPHFWPWPHVAWHIAAAGLAAYFLEKVI
jgi:hypothetical protein